MCSATGADIRLCRADVEICQPRIDCFRTSESDDNKIFGMIYCDETSNICRCFGAG